MKRFEESITAYPIQKPVNTGIQFEVQLPGCIPEFEAWEAATAAHCDMDTWMRPGGYSSTFKATVVAWYRLHRSISTHAQDAQNQATKSRMSSKK